MYYVCCTKRFVSGLNAGESFNYRVPMKDLKSAKAYAQQMETAKTTPTKPNPLSSSEYVVVGEIRIEKE